MLEIWIYTSQMGLLKRLSTILRVDRDAWGFAFLVSNMLITVSFGLTEFIFLAV